MFDSLGASPLVAFVAGTALGGAAGITLGVTLARRRIRAGAPSIESGPSALESIENTPVADAPDLTDQRDDEVRRTEAVAQLAGWIAHDFNNLLTSILGFAEMLARQLPRGSEPMADLDEIRHAGRKAAGLTRQLLNFSRPGPPSPTTMDLATVVDEYRRLLASALGEGTELEIELDTSGWVLADSGQIELLLVLLVLNARDRLSLGGAVRLELGVDKLDRARGAGFEGLTDGEYVRLTWLVRAGDETRRSADLVMRTGAVRQRRALVERIVRDCGGGMSLESDAAGERVTVLLPRVDSERGAGAELSAESVTEVHGTILVVEDETLVRRLIAAGLRDAGYTVLEAASAEEAYRHSDEHEGAIDLLVADVVMPVDGGVEVAARLLARRPELKVLYISGYAEDAMLERGLTSGEHAFLQKPFTPAELQAKIRACL